MLDVMDRMSSHVHVCTHGEGIHTVHNITEMSLPGTNVANRLHMNNYIHFQYLTLLLGMVINESAHRMTQTCTCMCHPVTCIMKAVR